MSAVLLFLAQHVDLLEAIYEAIGNRGVSKDSLMRAIKAEQVAAADAEMQRELA